jgi:hypothetical protein
MATSGTITVGTTDIVFSKYTSSGSLGLLNPDLLTGKITPGSYTTVEVDTYGRITGGTLSGGIGESVIYEDTGDWSVASIQIQGPNSIVGDTHRGIEIRHTSAGGVLIGGSRGSSWDSYFTVRTTVNSSSDYVDILKAGSSLFTYKGNEVQTAAHKGIAGGLATLDVNGKIPNAQLAVFAQTVSGDLNTYTTTGFYYVPANTTNAPTTSTYNLLVISNGTNVTQIAHLLGTSSYGVQTRSSANNGSTWNGWVREIVATDFTSTPSSSTTTGLTPNWAYQLGFFDSAYTISTNNGAVDFNTTYTNTVFRNLTGTLTNQPSGVTTNVLFLQYRLTSTTDYIQHLWTNEATPRYFVRAKTAGTWGSWSQIANTSITGTLSNLTTTDKSSLVNAINEVKANSSTGALSTTGGTMTGDITFSSTKGMVFNTPGLTKGRFFTLNGINDWIGWTLNSQYVAGSGWQLDDPNTNGWFFKLDSRTGGLSEFALYKIPAGAGYHTDEYSVFNIKASDDVIRGKSGVAVAMSDALGTLSSLTTTAKGNLVSAVNEVNGNIIGKAVPNISGALNSVTTTGNYIIPSGTTNAPSTQKFVLRVLSNGTEVSQIATDTAGATYVRHSSSNGSAWSNWINLISSSGGVIVGSNIYSGTTAPTSTNRINIDGYLYATRVYNAVFNDYAEYFEKKGELEPGDVVMLDTSENKEVYIKTDQAYSPLVVGVVSDSYGMCLGGNGDEFDEENFSPIGLSGRVSVKCIGKIKKGDLLVSSAIPGVAMTMKEMIPGSIIGKALEDKNSETIERVRMLIALG